MSDVKAVTDYNFDPEVLKCDIPVLTDFWAEWCAPCKALEPHLANIAEDYDDQLKVVRLDIEANTNTTSKYGVLNLPTLVLFKHGQEVERIMGAVSKKAIVEKVVPHLDS